MRSEWVFVGYVVAVVSVHVVGPIAFIEISRASEIPVLFITTHFEAKVAGEGVRIVRDIPRGGRGTVQGSGYRCARVGCIGFVTGFGLHQLVVGIDEPMPLDRKTIRCESYNR